MVDRITKILTRRPNAGQTLQAFAAAGFRGQPIEQTLAGMGFPDQRTQAKDLYNILTEQKKQETAAAQAEATHQLKLATLEATIENRQATQELRRDLHNSREESRRFQAKLSADTTRS